MLKKYIIPLITILILPAQIFALNNIYLDGMGAYTQAGDAEDQFGGGFGPAYEIIPGINIFNKNIFNSRKIRRNEVSGMSYSDRYSYILNIAGVEYNYNIKKMPLFAQAALGFGTGQARVSVNHMETRDTGLCVSFTAGLNCIITQHLSAFLNAGYQKTFFFDEFEKAKIIGLQVNLGLRFTIWGKNKSLFRGY